MAKPPADALFRLAGCSRLPRNYSFIFCAAAIAFGATSSNAVPKAAPNCLRIEGQRSEPVIDEMTAMGIYHVVARRVLPELDQGPWITEAEDGGTYWHVVSWRPTQQTEHGLEAMYPAPVDLRVSKCTGAISHIRITR